MEIINWFHSGGFVMYPLLICSLLIWGVIFERFFAYKKLKTALQPFQMEAQNILLRGDRDALIQLCMRKNELPTARILGAALDKLQSADPRVREKWPQSMDRRRALANQELKRGLWILGTLATSSPFIGLFGTVVGILRSFHSIAETGAGGFTVVASGISEALVATAAGIVVAVVAALAFNTFQTQWSQLVLQVKLETEELAETLAIILDQSLEGK